MYFPTQIKSHTKNERFFLYKCKKKSEMLQIWWWWFCCCCSLASEAKAMNLVNYNHTFLLTTKVCHICAKSVNAISIFFFVVVVWHRNGIHSCAVLYKKIKWLVASVYDVLNVLRDKSVFSHFQVCAMHPHVAFCVIFCCCCNRVYRSVHVSIDVNRS